MTTDVTEKPKEDQSDEHKFNRKEVIHLGFQNKTKGEAAFNAISYIGDGYFVVTAFSVFATWLLNDKIPGMGKAIRGLAEKHGFSGTIGTIATLFIGGTVASVLPVKWLEDRKPKVVKKLDYVLNTEDQFYNDPKIQAAHKELDELPKQTWLSVLGSRIVAFGATLAVFFAMGSNKSPLAKLTGHSLDEMSIKAGRGFDQWMNKGRNPEALSKIAAAIEHNKNVIPEMHNGRALPVHGIMNDGVADDRVQSRVYSYIALDAFYTAITSVSLWVSTRIFGAVVGKQPSEIAVNKSHKASEFNTAGIKAARSESINHNETTLSTNDNDTTPPTKVAGVTHLERVAEPARSNELTA